MNWTFDSFAKHIKKKRLERHQGSPQWYYFSGGTVEGKTVRLKGYKTYLQIYEVDGIRYGGLSDISVKDFDAELAKPFKK